MQFKNTGRGFGVLGVEQSSQRNEAPEEEQEGHQDKRRPELIGTLDEAECFSPTNRQAAKAAQAVIDSKKYVNTSASDAAKQSVQNAIANRNADAAAAQAVQAAQDAAVAQAVQDAAAAQAIKERNKKGRSAILKEMKAIKKQDAAAAHKRHKW